MIHRICFDGHFSSTKTLVEKMRRNLPFHFCRSSSRLNYPPPRIVRKKRNEAFWPATRGHRTARVVKERERKKERRSHRARGGGAGAGRGVV